MNKLSEKNRSKFYDFICLYEKEISNKFGSFNYNDKNLQSFLANKKILIGSLNKTNKNNAFKMKYHILWDDKHPSKYSSMKKDSVHNLLRHIRNSMAHGNIVSKGKEFELHDYNKNNKIPLEGKIAMSLFFQLINLLLASSSSKTSCKYPTF